VTPCLMQYEGRISELRAALVQARFHGSLAAALFAIALTRF